MTDYNAYYFGRVINAVSQLGNALSGGSADVSISARIGSMKDKNWFWRWCRRLVDFTFYPIDGAGHCAGAFFNDIDEDFQRGEGWLPGIIIMTLLMIAVCTAAIPFTWVYYLIKKLIQNGKRV